MPANKPARPGTRALLVPQNVTSVESANRAIQSIADVIPRITPSGNDPLFSATAAGDVPASGGGTINFLRADGTWHAPPTGSGINDGDYTDITVSGGGTVLTIDNNVVTPAKMDDGAALSMLGRSANSVGDRADVVAANDGDVLRRSGTAVGFGAIPESSVTNLVADLAALTAALAAKATLADVTANLFLLMGA